MELDEDDYELGRYVSYKPNRLKLQSLSFDLLIVSNAIFCSDKLKDEFETQELKGVSFRPNTLFEIS
ncbi:hypothetical protein [Chondrinema litorale]|uniref:hypothetical protein n=1 Tax=Chondrinema litorale TaxID=2994555 RepID=UPI00254316E7|nr:hypothetical protein [Chondrinema litorale]UZR98713.1 hypothetical protein OQ292_32405 [Chondrinema litorale]